MPSHADDLRVAHVLADSVESTLLGGFGSLDLTIERKPDGSFVSDADVKAEEIIRAQLARARPRDMIQGEELGTSGHGNRRWVIDPIDGTHSFVRGVPVWATLIGLVEDDEPVMGLVAAPALGRRWWATADGGAYSGRSLSQARPVRVSGTEVLAHASLGYNSRAAWADVDRLAEFDELCAIVWRARGYADFWAHVLVAEGAVDVAAEARAADHDLVALAPIVTAAGGRFTDLTGRPGPFGGSAVSSNGHLHDDVLDRIGTLAD